MEQPTNSAKSATNMTSELTALSLSEASELVRAGQVSPVDLVTACLARIDKLDRKLNAFVTVTREQAAKQAAEAETDLRHGRRRGPLHGIPIALKDLVDTAGVRTTAASNVFKDRVPAQDAEIARRLNAAGAILLGKLNMHEFAYGGSTVISAFGPVRNPWALDTCAGGSSAGSAAGVAARLCFGAIGSDTGGSIREPAAYTGIVGIKPTFGRVSARGVVPLSWSLDHLGPMTRTVRDAALMLQVLAGYDAGDSNSLNESVPDYTAALGRKTNFRLGVPRAYFYDDLHPEVQAAMNAALEVLAKLGQSEREIKIENGSEAATTVLRAEAFAFTRSTPKRAPSFTSPRL